MSSTFTRDPKPRIQYVADGSRTTFAFPFVVEADDDLLVFENELPAEGFAVDGLGDPEGGRVVYGLPPAAGTSITLIRRTESIRESAFVDGAPFRAATVNAEFDRLMMLIQEDRDAHGRALRVGPAEAESDLCLPPPAGRANRILGFDSAGAPTVLATGEVPGTGDASGATVIPSGASTARTLGEHLAALVNVRDFGALGDGSTDDAAAFGAALAAASARNVPVYVPAGPNAYVLGSGITLDGVRMIGDRQGSVVKLAPASGFGIRLTGDHPGLERLRLIGPGSTGWPASAGEVSLSGITLTGVEIDGGALGASLEQVGIAACHTALGIDGDLRSFADCELAYSGRGVEFRDGAARTTSGARNRIHHCRFGLRVDGASPVASIELAGGSITGCGYGIDLDQPTGFSRSVGAGGIRFERNLNADLRTKARHAVALRGGSIDDTGRRDGAQLRLLASGATTEAPSLSVQNQAAASVRRSLVALSGGTTLDLLAQGDLVVLASDPDDINDFWTASKATRAGIVVSVSAQTASTATARIALAGGVAALQAGDTIRVVGRAGTAVVDSVGPLEAASTPKWINAEDHCKVFAAMNPLDDAGIVLGGPNAALHHLPGLGGDQAAVGGVAFDRGALNGALVHLKTFTIAQDTAVSFTPASTIGMVHAFAHGSLGDIMAAIFTYRADGLGYTELLAGAADAKVMQLTALTGTTGAAGKVTYAANTDGKIYVENRLSGPPRTVSLFVVGAPLA